jgi:transposase
MWEKHQEQLLIIDKRIELLLQQLSKGKELPVKESKPKPIRHHAPKVEGLHEMLLCLYGVNVSSVSGINDYTLLRLIGETGTDMSRFAAGKYFVSWCGLSPRHHQSGKTNKRVKGTRCNKTGQIFKEIAQGLINSKHIAIGTFIRRIKARKDSAIAIKAGARKLALAYYNTLTKGIDYVEAGTKKYEEQIVKREKAVLYKLAKKYNMNMIDLQATS